MGLRLVIVASLAALVYCVDFQSPALANVHSCAELSAQDCWSYHEAFEDKCKSECDEKKKGGGDKPAGSTPSPDNPDKATPAPEEPKKGGGRGCFHGDDSVVTNYGPMKMSELPGRDDIQVLTRNNANQLEFSPISAWFHASPSVEHEYLVFTTESGHELPITRAHLIYETDCKGNSKTIFAKKVQIGKCLYVNDNGEFKESKVADIRKEIKFGVYAPLTENGNIIVNDVLASCFIQYENEAIQKIIFSSMRSASRFAKNILPSTVYELFFSTAGDIPQALLSFIDLSKPFIK